MKPEHKIVPVLPPRPDLHEDCRAVASILAGWIRSHEEDHYLLNNILTNIHDDSNYPDRKGT